MDYLTTIFVPTGNRRLNELIGFLMCVSALLLLLALVSYSPLDPSWNSASVLTGSHAARNWIGIVGAYSADAVLQFFGVGAFLLIIFPAMLGARWFRSVKVQSPLAKSLGVVWLLMFVPAMLALLPGGLRWAHVIPIEGLLGRVIGDHLRNNRSSYRHARPLSGDLMKSVTSYSCCRGVDSPSDGTLALQRPTLLRMLSSSCVQ